MDPGWDKRSETLGKSYGVDSIPVGQVRLIVFLPGEDEAGGHWADGVASEWSAELSDSREDIYTLEDGQPVNATR